MNSDLKQLNKAEISHKYYMDHNRLEMCSCGMSIMRFSMVKHKISKRHENRMIEIEKGAISLISLSL